MAYLLLACAALFGADARTSVIVVVGAEGTEEFGRQFRQWAVRWSDSAKLGNAEFTLIGGEESGTTTDRDQLKDCLARQDASATEPLWLILIGHGTYDGKTARFNLRGPDVSAAELADWLKPVHRPLAIVDCTSSSSPFLNELSGPDRVVITATRSGDEHNYARFGDSLSAAITDLRADLDKDEQTSLLEAFLFAARSVREFYVSEGRLATEHALIDDNGDRRGTPSDWFEGVRAVKSAKDGASVDGQRAARLWLVRSRHEDRLSAAARERRDQIEQDLARLRGRKAQLPEEEYLTLLEPLLVELSRLYESEPPTASPASR